MKKLVFLHGSGSDKNTYGDLISEVAKQWDADLVTFNAPFKHPDKQGKFRWFGKFENTERRDAIIEEYRYSLQYVKDQLSHLHTNTQNILLMGHSQGGGMAVHIGLEMELFGVISISGDLPYNILYKKVTNTPIYWLEGKKDTYINDNRKKSYRLIVNNNNFHFLSLENSSHNDFAADLLNAIRGKKIIL